MVDCVFCKIINGEIPSSIVYNSKTVMAFMDINPVAPFHCVVVPKEHQKSILEINPEIMVEITKAIKTIAKDNVLSENGFRVVNNCGKHGLQTVDHVHFHLMGKRQFGWPPG